jgi:hypothetical protein
MEKEFVPYDIALRLKNLGFDEPCFGLYNLPEQNLGADLKFGGNSNKYNSKWKFSAPTFSQAFRWFREKYNLIFQINYLFNGNYQVIIHKNTHEYMNLIQSHPHSCVDEVPDNYSYEDAELSCIGKLLEIVEQKLK